MIASRFDQVKIQFEKLISLIGPILISEHERTILENKLRRHFNTTSSDYLCSDDFSSLLDQTCQIFEKKSPSAKYFTQLASLDEQLKKNSIKLSKSNVSINDPTVIIANLPSPKSDTTEDDLASAAIQDVIDYLLEQCDRIEPDPPAMTADEVREEKRLRRITKLEGKLSRLSRMIRTLEETEMSLDDMADCDLYQVESNLKKRAAHVYAKLAELKSQSVSAERILYQPIVLPALNNAHPLVHEELQQMVNQWKYFPSFSDVLAIVEQSNEKHQLNISPGAQNVLAENFFKLIGKAMKTRRMADFHQVMSSRLPEDFDIEQNDPAVDNVEIQSILSKNEREAAIRTEQILEEFSLIGPDANTEMSVESERETNECHETVVDGLSMPREEDNLSEKRSSPAPEPIADEVPTAPTVQQTIEKDNANENDSPLLDPDEAIENEPKMEVTTPGGEEKPPKNQIIYALYTQRLTNNASPMTKRPLSNNSECSTPKRPKQHEPDIIVLD